MTIQTGAKHTPGLEIAEELARRCEVMSKFGGTVKLGPKAAGELAAFLKLMPEVLERLNAYPTLIASVEGIERFLGISDGPSLAAMIERDMKLGVFPKKSEATKAEEAEASRLHNLIKDSIKAGAPGLSDTTCGAIAQSVALKIRHAVSSLPTAQVKP